MQQENKKPENNQATGPSHSGLSGQPELSEAWQELLGILPDGGNAQASELSLPLSPLESDPWSELLQAKGVEVIDLQQVHLDMSDQDVEQILQVMQEQPASPPEDQPGSSSTKK